VNGPFDIAIVGSGFAGSLLALIARRIGLSVVLLEKGSHPRFAIGESTSPLTNLLLESLAIRYGLPRLAPLTKWGRWQATYPAVGGGLKRGFTFFAHGAGRPFANLGNGRDRHLVPASPRDEVADTHWYRPDVDAFFVKEAADAGVDYRDRFALHAVRRSRAVWEIEGRRDDGPSTFAARFLVDASGREAALAKTLGAPPTSPAGMPVTQALFSHFAGVRRLDSMVEFRTATAPPYPLDDAAVHHVFEGGWIWVLRFANGITSAGVAATEDLATELNFAAGEPAWRRLLDRFPTIRAQFEEARALRAFDHSPSLAFRRARAAGPGWALLPSAAAFADPLLSTGFPLTLLGIDRLARALAEDFGTPRFDSRLEEYETATLAEADRTAAFVGSLYRVFGDFPRFVERASLYFRAAESVESIARAHLSGDASRPIAFLDLPELAAVSASCATSSE
jgi:FADH2 O2-dependent halogenase